MTSGLCGTNEIVIYLVNGEPDKTAVPWLVSSFIDIPPQKHENPPDGWVGVLGEHAAFGTASTTCEY